MGPVKQKNESVYACVRFLTQTVTTTLLANEQKPRHNFNQTCNKSSNSQVQVQVLVHYPQVQVQVLLKWASPSPLPKSQVKV